MVEHCPGIVTDFHPKPAMKTSQKPRHSPCRRMPPDEPHFPVGVEVAHEDLGDRTASTCTSLSSPVFVRGIMHRNVSPRSFVAHVKYDASAAAIAAAVGVPEQDVENLWLAGVRTPAKRPVDPRVLTSKDVCMRFTPQSVLDCPIISGDSDGLLTSDAEHACRETGLDRGQFADLFQQEKKIDQQFLEFGNALIGKLEALAGTTRAFPRYQPPTRRRNMRMRMQTLSAHELDSADMQTPSMDTSRTCGFSEKDSHSDLEILCDGYAVCKKGNGLYRTARSLTAIRPPRGSESEVSFYFEVVIVEDKNAGGICVGVATESLPMNKLVGSENESCGIHSSGQLVTGNEFRPFGKSFKRGDRVGCLITVHSSAQTDDPRTPLHSENGSYSGMFEGIAALLRERDEQVELTFFINGEKQGTVREALWGGLPEEKRKLFPVVSLYKKESKAVVQCCTKDWAIAKNELENAVAGICSNYG